MKARVIYSNRGKPEYFIEGKKVSKKKFDEIVRSKPLGRPPMLSGNTPSCWPMKSDSMAVHPKQIPEVMERNRKHGIYVDYDPVDGRPILPDRRTRTRLMKLTNTVVPGGVRDNSGGYDECFTSDKLPKPKKKLFGLD